MTENIRVIAQEAALISTALDGESSVMPRIGHTEKDDNPVRMLAVGLEHAHAAIDGLLREVQDLRDELDRVSGDRPLAHGDDQETQLLEPDQGEPSEDEQRLSEQRASEQPESEQLDSPRRANEPASMPLSDSR